MAKKNSKANARRSYTAEFKRKAVLMTLREGVRVGDVADELGISAQYLSKWRQEFRKSSSQRASVEKLDAVAENQRLKEENKRLKMDIEILSKAASYFASRK